MKHYDRIEALKRLRLTRARVDTISFLAQLAPLAFLPRKKNAPTVAPLV